MLVELAIGDAYGTGFEFVADEMVRKKNDLSGYVEHPSNGVKPGCYADDTQMTVAIAEAVVSGEQWTREMLAQRFVTAFQRDPRNGYASGYRDFLHGVQDGAEFLAKARPLNECRGAALRAGPIGIYRSVPEVIRRAMVQAALTHNSADAIGSSVATALMTHYFLHRVGPKSGLASFITSHLPGSWMTPWKGKIGSKGTMSVRAAITAITDHGSLSAVLRTCIDFTGEVDTAAATALAAAACSEEIEQDLPEPLLAGLENGPYGRDFLITLNKRLLARVSRRHSFGS